MSSSEIVPFTGTDVVPATGTDVALMEDPPAAAEAPREIPPSRTVDPMLMKPKEAWRLVNRLRRARFYLNLELHVWETRFKEDMEGWRTHPMLQVTAKQAMDMLDELERRHADHWVRVHYIPADGTRYSMHFVAIG